MRGEIESVNPHAERLRISNCAHSCKLLPCQLMEQLRLLLSVTCLHEQQKRAKTVEALLRPETDVSNKLL